jgi:hypothetical protein
MSEYLADNVEARLIRMITVVLDEVARAERFSSIADIKAALPDALRARGITATPPQIDSALGAWIIVQVKQGRLPVPASATRASAPPPDPRTINHDEARQILAEYGITTSGDRFAREPPPPTMTAARPLYFPDLVRVRE